jgi:D-alanyl-D-alanine carboxypeptidase
VRAEAPAQVAAAPAAPAVAASAPARQSGFVLQIGAYYDEQSAASGLRALNTRSQTLSQLAPQRVQPVALATGGALYRLQAGSFADRSSAAAACEALKAEGVECFIADLASAQPAASDQASLTPFGTPAP